MWGKAYRAGLFCLVFSGQVLLAQVTTGTISGTVTDSTGAVLPGAKVVILNEDTGIPRTVQPESAGRYLAPGLSLGKYRVTTSLEGFQTEVRSGIVLTVGREAVVNFQLQVGAITQTVEVRGEAPLVESTTAAGGSLVDERAIRDLPLNGRSYDQLALLQPGVTAYAGGNAGFSYGAGVRFSVSGGRSYTNSFLLDGTDINDAANGTPGGAAGLNLGVEGIREFRILTSTYSAEYGRASGAVVNSVTKSGTNELHGVAFHFLRNSALDARNFFDRDPSNPLVRSDPPPFKRNQFGGALGGPIQKDRTFFFGNYEGLRQRLATTGFATVPTAEAKNGILPVLDRDNRAVGTRTVPVNPAVRPFLALYPNPNGNIHADGTGNFLSANSVPTTEDYLMVRIDHQVNQNHSLFGRYSFDDDSRVELNSLANVEAATRARRQYATLQLNSSLSPVLLNNFRFAFNRSGQFTDSLPTEQLPPEVSFIPGLTIGNLGIRGRSAASATVYAVLGTSDSAPRSYNYNLFEWGDDLTYIRGKHSLKFGGSAKRIRDNTAQNTSLRGLYSFDTFETLLLGTPASFSAVKPGQDAYRGIRQSIFNVYGQDDLKVNSRLTLNLGIRWEAATEPGEVNGKVSNLVRLTDPAVTVLDRYFQLSKKNIQPRVGFAWQFNSSGTSVVRGGFGIFHDQVVPLFYSLQVNKYPPFYELLQVNATAPNIRFPDAYLQLGQQSLVRLTAVAPNHKTPAKNHYQISIQQQLFTDMVVEAAYVGSKATNLWRVSEHNTRQYVLVNGQKFFPAGSPRKNPNFDEIRTITTDTDSNYNSLQLKVRRTSSRGLQFQVAYTYAKSIDELSGIGTTDIENRDSGASLDPEDPGRDRGRSIFDMTHNFVVNFSYPIPVRFQQKVPSFLLGGWEVSGITTLRSGQPSTPQLGFEHSRNGGGGRGDRPDLVPGASLNPIQGVTAGCTGTPAGEKLGTPNRWFDPCAFQLPAIGTYGNVGRTTITGPGLRTFDLSLVKNFSLSEAAKLQFRAEFFNLFNRANFGAPRPLPLASNGSHPSTAARITNTTTTSRQIQLAMKISF